MCVYIMCKCSMHVLMFDMQWRGGVRGGSRSVSLTSAFSLSPSAFGDCTDQGSATYKRLAEGIVGDGVHDVSSGLHLPSDSLPANSLTYAIRSSTHLQHEKGWGRLPFKEIFQNLLALSWLNTCLYIKIRKTETKKNDYK